MLPDLADRVSGAWYDLGGCRLSEEAVRALVFEQGPVAYLKSEVSRQGRGVVRLMSERFTAQVS